MKLGQILHTLIKIVAQVTERLVQPFALSVYDGCAELSRLLSWYFLKRVKIPSRFDINVMSTSHAVRISAEDKWLNNLMGVINRNLSTHLTE